MEESDEDMFADSEGITEPNGDEDASVGEDEGQGQADSLHQDIVDGKEGECEDADGEFGTEDVEEFVREGVDEEDYPEQFDHCFSMLPPHIEVDNSNHACTYKYPEEWISNVTSFCCEGSAIAACNEYQRVNFCALSQIRGGGRPDLSKGKKGKINLVCVHGIDQTRTRTQKALKRKRQHKNFKGCRMRIFIRQQLSGEWILRSFIPEHIKENGDLAHLSGI